MAVRKYRFYIVELYGQREYQTRNGIGIGALYISQKVDTFIK